VVQYLSHFFNNKIIYVVELGSATLHSVMQAEDDSRLVVLPLLGITNPQNET
jgi:hypothetical protein